MIVHVVLQQAHASGVKHLRRAKAAAASAVAASAPAVVETEPDIGSAAAPQVFDVIRMFLLVIIYKNLLLSCIMSQVCSCIMSGAAVFPALCLNLYICWDWPQYVWLVPGLQVPEPSVSTRDVPVDVELPSQEGRKVLKKILKGALSPFQPYVNVFSSFRNSPLINCFCRFDGWLYVSHAVKMSMLAYTWQVYKQIWHTCQAFMRQLNKN